jgi:hypothetical protein
MTAIANPTHILDLTPLMAGTNPTKVTVQVEIPEELTVLGGTEQPAPGCGAFRILHQLHGDKRVTWRRNVIQEINAAKKLFVDLVKEGLTPYKVGTGGSPSSEVMREFDAMAEEVIFLPKQMVTGG